MALPSLSFVNPDSEWFQYYSRTLLEAEPDVARVLLTDTLEAISKRLSPAPRRQGAPVYVRSTALFVPSAARGTIQKERLNVTSC